MCGPVKDKIHSTLKYMFFVLKEKKQIANLQLMVTQKMELHWPRFGGLVNTCNIYIDCLKSNCFIYFDMGTV